VPEGEYRGWAAGISVVETGGETVIENRGIIEARAEGSKARASGVQVFFAPNADGEAPSRVVVRNRGTIKAHAPSGSSPSGGVVLRDREDAAGPREVYIYNE